MWRHSYHWQWFEREIAREHMELWGREHQVPGVRIRAGDVSCAVQGQVCVPADDRMDTDVQLLRRRLRVARAGL